MFNLYWLYNLPNWLFGTIIIAFFSVFGLVGLFTTRGWVRRQHQENHSHNDIVSYYLAAITVFYGITLGLLAVATWTSYSATEDKVDNEAQVLASLYRDVNSLPEPFRSKLDGDLRDYTHMVIYVSWPLQRQGIVPSSTDGMLDVFQADLLAFEPTSERAKIVDAESYKQFNLLVEARRARLESVTTGMPQSLWSLVILGGLISIVVTLFFDTKSLSMHFWMTVLMSTLLGLIVFLIATLDNPYRGKVSIAPGALVRVYEQVMMKP